MSGYIEQQGNYFKIYFQYNARIVDRVKEIPGRRFNPLGKCWEVHIENRIAVERFAHANKFTFGKPQEVEQVFEIPPMPDLDMDIPLKMEMFPYQKQGVAYNLQKRRTILGDKPGLGKTVQAIATLIGLEQQGIAAFPTLVICPSALKENWRREWSVKWSNKKAMVLEDKIRTTFPRYWEYGMADVFIVNFESLKKYFVKSLPKREADENGRKKRITIKDIVFLAEKIGMFKSVIVDESHRCKSFATLTTKFVKGICTGKDNILLCTGTPVMNKPVELVPQLGIIDQLGAFGGYKGFINRYCAGMNNASNLKELNYKLRLNCFYQRDKSEVLKDLPPKIRQIVYCDITNRKEYDDAEADLMKYLRQYQNADDEKVERALRGEIMVKMGILKNIAARGKMEAIFEYIDDLMASGEKLILFGYLKEIIQAIKQHYPDCVTVTGDDNEKQKQAAVDKFQNDDNCKLFVGNIIAAGVGLTLTAASRVAFIEQWWNPAIHDQAEDRAHRIGQKDSVSCIYFLGKDTIDEKVYDIIDKKRGMVAAVTGSAEAVEESVISDLINLFNQKVA
ncbi:DEAD/DEAH box helicase [Pedobacter sp. BS3]|uniref:DEAD/DEAH box helicase n=1 Tax=Pedobacter sp. BS3 TaxID=2567937 RepID=UPI0011EC9458|nr:DEAD/DEAH box helicase [Pedobacter sp. BS3]TZF84541.1 DEAD/DEAH box helicase [Pedobacter sp. BS3]